jgi:HEAT repeat protein
VRTVLDKCKNDEIIADGLKFLCEPCDLPVVHGHLGHPSWVVRLQAARALGRIGTCEDLPHLTTLLGDSSWWVRYRAAQALVALTRGEPQVLSQLKSNLTDRYARDMLDMAMAEQGGQ